MTKYLKDCKSLALDIDIDAKFKQNAGSFPLKLEDIIKNNKVKNEGPRLGGELHNYAISPSHTNDSFFTPRDTNYSITFQNTARHNIPPIKPYQASLKQQLMNTAHAASVYYGSGVRNPKLSPLAK